MYIIFGLSNRYCNDPFFSKYVIFNAKEKLENVLKIVQPDIIFHLASITNAEECSRNPIKTIETNGVLMCKILDIIYTLCLNTKIINACSCEIYKGNGTYVIEEDDDNYKPTHPYAYAKLLSHYMIKEYRMEKNLWASNAILFTTESPYRKDTFLIKKCANHIKDWKSGKKYTLKLGNLSSYRNINHALDVALGLLLISKQDIGDDYLVCSDNYYQVKELIILLYKTGGIDLIENCDKGIFYNINNESVIEFNTYTRGFEANLTGNCTKLKKIGWDPIFNIESIFKDLLK